MNGTKHFCPDERDMPFVPDFLEVLGAAGRVGTGRMCIHPVPVPPPLPFACLNPGNVSPNRNIGD